MRMMKMRRMRVIYDEKEEMEEKSRKIQGRIP
jgi:hypothetical protein